MLQKQAVNIPFGIGLDTKTDPKQVSPGKLLALQNAIFDKGGLLQKRNGYKALPALPDATSTNLTTFKGNLTAIGNKLFALNSDSSKWVTTGSFQPVHLDVLPIVRSSTSQLTADVAVASNGLACTTWVDSDGFCYYQVFDSITGQIIVPSVQLPATAHEPTVFAIGFFILVVFTATVSGSPHLQRIAIPINNPSMPSIPVSISSQVKSLTAGYDGCVYADSLYLSWNGSDLGGAIRTTFIDSHLNQHNTRVIPGHNGDLISVTPDVATPEIWVTFWDSGSQNAFSAVYDPALNVIRAATQTITASPIANLTSAANAGVLTIFSEVINTYSYSSTRTDYINKVTVTDLGVVGPTSVLVRSVGLSGAAFYFPGTNRSYVLASYSGAFQPTYFLIDDGGSVIAKLAYSNGAGYATNKVLSNPTVIGSDVYYGYLFKDLLVPVNKSQNAPAVAGIYAQTGINMVKFTINDTGIIPSEIGANLNLTGGFLWAYDGVKPVEQNFHLWPEDILVTTSGAGGNVSAQEYFYQFTYEWTDAQGNLFRSAPSVPMSITTTGATSSNTIKVPTLRLTYKGGLNKVRIVGYRWSTAQQIFYQFTSISSPVFSDPTVDSVTIVDTLSDADILGNVILYTTGGVVENIGPPACSTMAIFKSRLFLVDAEDPNLLWFSKQVIEATPVEMSDLLTIFVPPTIGAQGSTGAIRALAALDDKLIIFKENAIYYITGTGPDNTGASNDFSEPIFISSTVGCANQSSIVFSPLGLIFESDKGRWLLGRDLTTNYIGAPVEAYNSATTDSAINVPGTNQVRMTLNSGVTLMFDYYFNQWGTFTDIPAISSTIYEGLHTYLDSTGRVFQENPGSYVDDSNPVLMSFTTAWFAMAGFQGYQRAYFFYLLGQYFSPHKLMCSIAYDFDPNPKQGTLISPTNFAPTFGGAESNGQNTVYGQDTPYGGPSDRENWRVFLDRQRCMSFQITVSETYDPTFGVPAGQGLTLSGINLVYAVKKGFRPISAAHSAGGLP